MSSWYHRTSRGGEPLHYMLLTNGNTMQYMITLGQVSDYIHVKQIVPAKLFRCRTDLSNNTSKPLWWQSARKNKSPKWIHAGANVLKMISFYNLRAWELWYGLVMVILWSWRIKHVKVNYSHSHLVNNGSFCHLPLQVWPCKCPSSIIFARKGSSLEFQWGLMFLFG